MAPSSSAGVSAEMSEEDSSPGTASWSSMDSSGCTNSGSSNASASGIADVSGVAGGAGASASNSVTSDRSANASGASLRTAPSALSVPASGRSSSDGKSMAQFSMAVSGGDDASSAGGSDAVASSDSRSENQSSAPPEGASGADAGDADAGCTSGGGATFFWRAFLAADPNAAGGTASVNVGARSLGSCSGSGASGSIGRVSESVRRASKRLSQRPQRTMPSEACSASSSIA